MSDRVEAIRKLLTKAPKDLFLIYSLGMELASAGMLDDAVEEFGRCLAIDPEYLPAYTEAGKALRQGGQLARARAMFQAGLDLAVRLGLTHDRDYLQQQLESLPKT